MILDEVINFLRKEPPFQYLDEAALRFVGGNLSMEFYPKDTVILRQDGPTSESLRIIKKGAVKVLMKSEDGNDVAMDYKGEGDNFGFLSMIGKDRQKTTVIAVYDTICYILAKEKVLKLLEISPPFTEYFMSYLSRYVDRTYREMQSKSLLYGSSDRFLITTRIGDMAVEAITAHQDTTIQQTATIMVNKKVSSVVIVDGQHLPVGIITDRDLRGNVVASGRSVSEPVRNIMTTSLIRADSADSCFEAVLMMIRHNIHHLLVMDEGGLKGILTNHDVMLLQGTSPLAFAADIENQDTIEGLGPVSRKINKIVGLLLEEGTRAVNITRIISELNDRLESRVLEISEYRLAPPPVPYCWIVFGSEGRKEQIFRTDYDYAIIYADSAMPEDEEKIRDYFTALALHVKTGLEGIGFAAYPGDYSASNPIRIESLKGWKKSFSEWISEPTPDAVIKSLVFFDFRPLYGKLSLAEDLRIYLKSMLDAQVIFLGHMANMVLKNTPPVGFLKSFVVEKSGEHKDEFNFKIKGIAPLVDTVRLIALEKGVAETSTLERIKVLADRHTFLEEYASELEQALDSMILIRTKHQFELIKKDLQPDNFVNPDRLTNLEKKTLREAFHLISKVQGIIFEKYRPFIR